MSRAKQHPPGWYDGKVAIVTGGGSGIGQAICLRLADNGVVGVLDRDTDGARRTVELVEDNGGRAVVLSADVTSSTSLAAAFDDFRQTGAVPQVVVACAGVERIGTVMTEPEEDWDFQMNVNAKGVYLTARAAFPGFLDQGGGSFVAIASDAGVIGTSDFGIYTASKHAVVGLVKCLALDFAHHGIRSNAVCPGNVRTPMMDVYLREHPEEEQWWLRAVPLGRFAEPREIADAVAYLASDEAAYVNGSVVLVDGGDSVGSFTVDTVEAVR